MSRITFMKNDIDTRRATYFKMNSSLSQLDNEQMTLLVENVENVHADGIMSLSSNYVDQVVKYRDIILMMHDFLNSMSHTNKKNTKYKHAKLRRLLRETKFNDKSIS